MDVEIPKTFFKLVVVGPPSVGKTSIIRQFTEDLFYDEYRTTIGADFSTKRMVLDGGEAAVLQLWDTAGQERYRSLGGPFYRGAAGVMFVFDVSDPGTLDSVSMWYGEFIRQSGMDEDNDQMEQFPIVLVGNKVDKGSKISDETVGDWLAKNNIRWPYFQTSAKENTGIEEAFQEITKLCLGPEWKARQTAGQSPVQDTIGGAAAAAAAPDFDQLHSESMVRPMSETEDPADPGDTGTINSDRLSEIMSNAEKPDSSECGCLLL